MSTARFTSWKRFSLRGLFVLMSVCCVVLGRLWSAYVNPYRRQAQSIAVLRRLPSDLTINPADGPAWQRWLVTTMLGEDTYVKVEAIALRGPRIDDDVMRELSGLHQLKSLVLEQTQVTDAGLSAVRSMRDLETLSLAYSLVTDRGIAELQSLPKLADLKLTGTQITDATVPELAKLPAAKVFFIRWTRISDVGADQLQAAAPQCAVYHQALSND